jgi:hypothetical protein
MGSPQKHWSAAHGEPEETDQADGISPESAADCNQAGRPQKAQRETATDVRQSPFLNSLH